MRLWGRKTRTLWLKPRELFRGNYISKAIIIEHFGTNVWFFSNLPRAFWPFWVEGSNFRAAIKGKVDVAYSRVRENRFPELGGFNFCALWFQTRVFQGVLRRSRAFQNVPRRSRALHGVRRRSKTFQSAPRRSKAFLAVPGYSWAFQVVPGRSSTFQGVPERSCAFQRVPERTRGATGSAAL